MTSLKVKSAFKILYRKFLLIGLSLFPCSSNILAGAWVKESGNYYAKLSLSQSSERLHTAQPSNSSFNQKDTIWHLYGETGLSLMLPLQLSVYIPYKIIERTTVDKLKTFANKGIGDTELSLKYPLLKPSSFFYTPAKFLVALSAGMVFPTTSKDFRFNNEERRHHEVPQENQNLISGIDRGKFLYMMGLDSSIYWKASWLSLGERVLGSSSGTKTYESKIDFGLGLPSHSWIQTSWSRLISKAQNSSKTSTTKYGVSLGWTAISNVALELGYFWIKSSNHAWEDKTEIFLGFSRRTL